MPDTRALLWIGGRGQATEAVSGLIGHLLGPLGKHRVFASADPSSSRSLALRERAGMGREAPFRDSQRFKGECVDDVVDATLESPSPDIGFDQY